MATKQISFFTNVYLFIVETLKETSYSFLYGMRKFSETQRWREGRKKKMKEDIISPELSHRTCVG